MWLNTLTYDSSSGKLSNENLFGDAKIIEWSKAPNFLSSDSCCPKIGFSKCSSISLEVEVELEVYSLKKKVLQLQALLTQHSKGEVTKHLISYLIVSQKTFRCRTMLNVCDRVMEVVRE